MESRIVVTRHKALLALLREKGLVGENTDVIEHATPENVRGRDVIGILPLSLAAEANSVTEIPLSLTPADRGVELSLDRIRSIASDPVTYKVTRV